MSDYTQSTLLKKSTRNKALFRKRALDRLRKIPPVRARFLDHRILSTLVYQISQIKPKSVMLYVPLDSEVNVMPLISWLRRKNINVYVPFMEGESFRLVQYRLPLKIKKYGVREPGFSNKYRNKILDIAIVPIVGTDVSMRRIGFGKGMYDRFFDKTKDNIKHVIFVQRLLQKCNEVITDEWDVHGDILVTAG